MENKDLTWKSCCRTNKCPVYAVDDEFFYIRDDFGNEIRIKHSQLKDLSETLVELVE